MSSRVFSVLLRADQATFVDRMSAKPSVTFVAYDRAGGVGGPRAWAMDFVRYLKQSEHKVRVLILCPGGAEASPIAAFCRDFAIDFAVMDSASNPWLEDETEWILAQWASVPTSIFLANLVLPAMFASRWISDAGATTIGVVHSDPRFDPFYASMITQFVSGGEPWALDTVVGVSNGISSQLRSVAKHRTRIETISCGTRVPVRLARAPLRELKLLYCGRLAEEQKRIRELTEALIAAANLDGVTAAICGDGPELAWVENRLSDQPRVTFLGIIPPARILETMADYHAIILLSDYEGLSIALVEGMACGLVPICLDKPDGVREVIQNHVNGLLVTDREGSFLRAVDQLRTEHEWERLSRNARETALLSYSHPVVFAKWTALMQSMPQKGDLQLSKIPKRVDLRKVRQADAFPKYPKSRPGRGRTLLIATSTFLTEIRTAIRPRARLRELRKRLPN